MAARYQTACAVAGLVGLVLILAGVAAAGLIPPPKASWSAQRLSEFYASHSDLKRFGAVLLLFGVTGFGALVAGMTVVLARIEERPQVMAILQAVLGAVVAAQLTIFAVLIGAAAFRPGRDPEITQALHDIAFFILLLAVVAPTLQALVIAWPVFADKSPQPLVPRWFAWANVAIAVLFLPGVVLVLFKSGPLAYQGVLSFWVALAAFAAWIVAMAWAIRRSALTPLT